MKFVAFLLIFVSVSYAFDDQCQGDYLKSIYKKCLLANGGDRVVIDDLHKLKNAEDDNGKCFRECLLRECEYYGDDGKFKPDTPTRLAWAFHRGDETRLEPIAKAATKCMGSQTYGDSKCDNAENFARCMINQSPFKLKIDLSEQTST